MEEGDPIVPEVLDWRQILGRAAELVGGQLLWSDRTGSAGLIALPDGQKTFYHKGVLDLNGVAASRVARDKGFTNELLSHLRFRVPDEHIIHKKDFRSDDAPGWDAAGQIARRIGYPLFVKPVHRSKGVGVSKVHDELELRAAILYALTFDSSCLLQAECRGIDLRVILVKRQMIGAYERHPLKIIGDGVSTVSELLENRQSGYVSYGRDTRLDFSDPRLLQKLRRENTGLEAVLAAGRELQVYDVANLSLGAEAVDVGDRLAPEIFNVAVRVADALDLGVCAVDLIVDEHGGCSVLEVNSAPGLDNYLYQGQDPVAYAAAQYAKVFNVMMSI